MKIFNAERIKFHYAFTLIELLIVIVVIATLAVIIIPKFSNIAKRSKQAASSQNIATLKKAVNAFNVDTGLMPLTLNDLTAAAPPANGANPVTGATTALNVADWHGPYYSGTLPTDPLTGNAYTVSVAAGSVGSVSVAITEQDAIPVTGGVTFGGALQGTQQQGNQSGQN